MLPYGGYGRDRGHGGGDLGAADRAVDVDAVGPEVGGRGVGADRQLGLQRDLRDRVGVGQVGAGLQDRPGDGPVHRAGVQVDAVQRGREAPGDGGLTGAGRAVDGHHALLRPF